MASTIRQSAILAETAPATPAREVLLRATATEIQWRYTNTTWVTLLPLSALVGPAGASVTGPAGADGVGITGAQGIPGVAGASVTGSPGVDAKQVELRVDGGVVQWRRVGESWQSLISVASISGANGSNGTNGVDGRSVELQKAATAVQWRVVGGTWADLVLLSALKGDAGSTGPTGPSGTAFLANGTLTQTAVVAIAVGVREVAMPVTGTIAGGAYFVSVTSHRLNGGASQPGRPAGYYLADWTCRANGVVQVVLSAPLLAIGQSYEMTCAVYRVG